MGRAPCCDKENVKKGPWSPEEDAQLKAYIEKHGTGGNWIALPQKIGIKRCGKSCRLRWLNYLRPNIKHGGFSEEEDNIICNLYISIGSRWSIIAAQLPGRTDNDIKNYWNTRLKKKLLGRKKQSNGRRLPSSTDNQDASSSENSALSPALSNSALERLQLHMRLQGLSSPLSLYNNPVLWPKIHSLHDEKTVDNLQLSSKNNLNNIHPADRVQTDHLIDVNPHPGNDLIVSPFYEPAFTPDSISWVQQEWIRSNSLMKNPPVPEETSPSIEQMLCGDSVSMGSLAHDISSLIHSEHQVDGILGNYCSNTPGGNDFMPQESVQHHQVMLELDCIKGILDDSSSWDGSSDSVDVQAGGSMFQGYEIGYNNI